MNYHLFNKMRTKSKRKTKKISSKRKKISKISKRKTTRRKKSTRRKNPDSGIVEILPLKGRGKGYHIAAKIAGTDDILFKSDKTYDKRVIDYLTPQARKEIEVIVKEEDKKIKRKNPSSRGKTVSKFLDSDVFEKAIAQTQGMPKSSEDAFQLGYISGLSEGLQYCKLRDIFKRRTIQKRINKALDKSLSSLVKTTLLRGEGMQAPINYVVSSQTRKK